jgi:RHS repeat-associated protein
VSGLATKFGVSHPERAAARRQKRLRTPPSTCFAQTGSTATKNYTYDAADRVTNSGYSYDAFGRTTAIPAAQAASGTSTSLSYYVSDRVNTITANSTTVTFGLDAAQRVRTFVSTADSQVHTHHYSGDSDVPSWTAENTAGTSWTRNLVTFNGLAAIHDSGAAVRLQLASLHDDIDVEALPSDTTWSGGWTPVRPYGQAASTPARYDYVGAHLRQRDTNSQLQLMGARVYNPATGRFTALDPILGGSANSYDYCNGDALSCTDLSGALPAMVKGSFCGIIILMGGFICWVTFTYFGTAVIALGGTGLSLLVPPPAKYVLQVVTLPLVTGARQAYSQHMCLFAAVRLTYAKWPYFLWSLPFAIGPTTC